LIDLDFILRFRITFKTLIVVKHACMIKSTHMNFVVFVCLIRLKYQIIYPDLPARIKKNELHLIILS
jgi:hypothetical protein